MSLEDWSNSGIIIKQATSLDEIRRLFKSIDLEFKDFEGSKAANLSLNAVFRFAYNAMRQTAALALRAEGYRVPGRNGSHYWILQSLQYTIGVDSSTIDVLDKHRRKRNAIEYEGAEEVSSKEADDIACLAMNIYKELKAWLKEKHPEYIQDGD